MAEKKAKKAPLTLEQALGIEHIAQALFILPRQLRDYRNPVKDLRMIRTGMSNVILMMRVVQMDFFSQSGRAIDFKDRPAGRLDGRASRVRLHLEDQFGKRMRCTSFAPYDWVKVWDNMVVGLSADIGEYNSFPTLDNVSYIPRPYLGKICPVYPAIRKRASAERIFEATRIALREHLEVAADYLLAGAGLRLTDAIAAAGMDPKAMLKGIHYPADQAEYDRAIEAAKKFSIREVLAKSDRIRNRPPEKRSMLLTTPVEFSGITMTGDQQRALSEILADLRSGFPMRRLLSGDVGRGKTIPMVGAAASVWLAARAAGKQVNIAMMLPNEPLVEQVIGQFARFFPEVECSPLTGKKKLFTPGSIVVGTSAIAFLKNYQADLLIVDEQHKFSRGQREAVSGPHTNLLEATATAIPRSIALITHGGMEVSILRESPVVKDIHTHLVADEDRAHIYHAIRHTVESGKRALIVYPLVEESEVIDATTVEQGYEAWRKMLGDRVGMVHGKMDPTEKMAAIQAMRDNRLQVLVSSTVVEVGLDIPDIETMVIVSPQRLGLNQLHQLRGRLARNGGRGDLYLFPNDQVSEEALSRLVALVETNDGFEIAERDMNLRGFGDLGADSDEQTGAAEVTFRGLKLMPADFSSSPAVENEQSTPRASVRP